LAEIGDLCELLIVLGGDGTILTALHSLGSRVPPVFGINLGTLGFLTGAALADYDHALGTIRKRAYAISPRSLLSVRIERDGSEIQSWRALNEAVIGRGEISRLVHLRVTIGSVLLTEYHADGLIIATPTGSTAYSMSAGGPILMPESGVFVVNPICPHVLTNRPVIVDDGQTLTVERVGVGSKLFLTVDGQADREVLPGDRVVVERAADIFPLAFLPENSFFDVLRQKLKWSGTIST
jgi:NAD+ kinase